MTGEIKNLMRTKAQEGPYDILVVEIGGTVGDIENIHFIEAAREMLYDEGRDNVLSVHVTQVPYKRGRGRIEDQAHATQRQSAPATGHSARYCGLPFRHTAQHERPAENQSLLQHRGRPRDQQPGYGFHLPGSTLLDRQKTVQIVADKLNVNLPQRPDQKPRVFDIYLKYLSKSHPEIRIAITGKYTALHDSYVSILNALDHSKVSVGAEIDIEWIDTTEYSGDRPPDAGVFEGISGIIVPGGFGERGAEGKIPFIQFARENGLPFLGLCYGFQLAVIEFARNQCGLRDAAHAEFDAETETPVIYLLPDQRKLAGMGGTMRLGGHEVKVMTGTTAHGCYGSELAMERFRHRYEFNNQYRELIEHKGHGVLRHDT